LSLINPASGRNVSERLFAARLYKESDVSSQADKMNLLIETGPRKWTGEPLLLK